MSTLKELRFALLCVLVIGIFPGRTVAQSEHPATVQRRNDCRLAVQVIRTGHPATKTQWALDRIAGCGADGGGAIAAAMRAARASADTVLLERLTRPTMWLRDGSSFQTALEIGADRTASPQARVFALRTLLWAMVPGGSVGYGDLADEVQGRGRRCLGFGPSTHVIVARGSPLPADWEQRVRALAARLMRDPAEPRPVRRAAVCTQLFEPSEAAKRLP